MLVPKKTVDPQIITFCHYLLYKAPENHSQILSHTIALWKKMGLNVILYIK